MAKHSARGIRHYPEPVTDTEDLSEQMLVRLGKREAMLAEGIEPYPVHLDRSHSLSQVRATWGHLQADEETDQVVGIGGRVVFLRNSGKLCFATLQDGFTASDNGDLASRGRSRTTGALEGPGGPRGFRLRPGPGDRQPPRRAVGAGHRMGNRQQGAPAVADTT